MQHQLRTVKVQPDGYLIIGNAAQIFLIRADSGDLVVELVWLDGDDFFKDLDRR